MSYIGNTPFTAAFLTDTFSGNGSTVAFTMSVAPATTSSVIVAITGVLQDPSTYSVSGTTLTFSAAPPTGTSNISVRYLGIPASGVTTTAYRTVTDTTATAGQTTFSIPSYTVGYVDVYRNGSRLAASDYTATSGTSVVLVNAATAGDTITTESFYVSSVLNALPNTGGTLSGQLTVNSATGQKPLIAQVNGTEVFEVDASGNVGIGTSSPAAKLDVAVDANAVAYMTYTRNANAGSSAYAISGWGNNSNSNAGQIAIASSTNGTYGGGGDFIFLANTGDMTLRTTTAKPMTFYTNGTERMRIDTSGNLLVGTTSSWSPPAGTSAKIFQPNGYAVGNSTTSANFTNDRIVFNASQFYVLNAASTGVVLTSGNTAWAAQSDERTKDIVEPIADAVNKVSTLRAVIGKYKTDEDGTRRSFLIAQDVQAVLPEAVSTADDEQGTLSLRYTEVIPLLVAAIQEQQALITALQADVEALKGNP